MGSESDDNSRKLHDFVIAVSKAEVLDEALAKELQLVGGIVSAPSCKDEAELSRMKDAYDLYVKGKTGQLYKPFTLFPTGIQCLGKASAVFESLTKDKALELELDRAVQLIQHTQLKASFPEG